MPLRARDRRPSHLDNRPRLKTLWADRDHSCQLPPWVIIYQNRTYLSIIENMSRMRALACIGAFSVLSAPTVSSSAKPDDDRDGRCVRVRDISCCRQASHDDISPCEL